MSYFDNSNVGQQYSEENQNFWCSFEFIIRRHGRIKYLYYRKMEMDYNNNSNI